MPEADVIDNGRVLAALTAVSEAVTSMRADIDALKQPKGRTSNDLIDEERIDRKNAAVSDAQEVLDNARRVRAAAKETLDRIRAAREERPSAGRDNRPGGMPRNHLNGEPLTADQVSARAEYREKFKAWLKTGRDGELIQTAPKAAMQTQIAEKGGFLVPEEMERSVIELGTLYSPMRSICDVRTINQGNSLKQPANVQGATAGWTGELASRTETATDDIAMLQWFLMEAYAQPKVTNILLADAEFDVEGWLNEGITREFADLEGAAFISGGGVNSPRGIQSYTVVANGSYAWGSVGYIPTGVSAAITDSSNNGYDALLDMITALHRRYLPNARFLMNRTSETTIRKVKDGNENYMWQPSVSIDKPATLFGYPVEIDDNAPAAGSNTYPVMLGDFQQAYRIVQKAGMMMLRDEVTDKGRTIFYTTRRVGGGIKNFEAVKFLKCATS